MQWISDLQIKYKLFIVPLVGVLGFATYLMLNFNSNSANAERLNSIQNVYFPILENADKNMVTLERITQGLNAAVSNGEIDLIDDVRALAKDMEQGFANITNLEPVRQSDISNIEVLFRDYLSKAIALSEGMINGTLDPSRMSSSVSDMTFVLKQLNKDLELFRDESHQQFIANIEQTVSGARNAFLYGVAVAAVTILVLLALAMGVTASITSNIGNVVVSLKNIARGEGDLTKRIRQTSDDEIGELVHWFNLFVDKLQQTIGEVVSSVKPLSEMSTNLTRLASETDEVSAKQLNSTVMVSTSIHEMLTTLEDNARNTTMAAEAAHEAEVQAQDGSAVVQITVNSINLLADEVERAGATISELEANTESVGSILDVIQGIAAQTNLLALNAAIEAARAGEQGRGFAVVADEVRTLASKTQESTKEIQQVIEQLQKTARLIAEIMKQGQSQANESVDKAATAGSSLQEIANKVETISTMSAQIASATEQQQVTSEEIQRNINAISQTAEDTAEGANKVAEYTQGLSAVSDKLESVASQFKI